MARIDGCTSRLGSRRSSCISWRGIVTIVAGVWANAGTLVSRESQPGRPGKQGKRPGVRGRRLEARGDWLEPG